METLLEFKAKVISFVEKNEPIVKPIARFILMLIAFLLVFNNLTFYSKLDNVLIPLMLSVVSAVVPSGIGGLLLILYILGNLYGMGYEVLGVGAILFIIFYLLYFRFCKDEAHLVILAPVLNALHVPYVLPVAIGLKYKPQTSLTMVMGTMIYYFLSGIKANKEVLLATEGAATASKLSVAIRQIFANTDMWVLIVAFIVTSILIYLIRRLSINNSWRISLYVGIPVQLVIILIGKLVFGSTEGIVGVIIGSIVAFLVGLVMEFILFNLDYQRTERAQFEDDNYYYYVKAVPKMLVAEKKVQVKTFGGRDNSQNDDDDED